MADYLKSGKILDKPVLSSDKMCVGIISIAKDQLYVYSYARVGIK